MSKLLMAVVVAASLILAGTGTVFAEEGKAPELGDWGYWEAVESGNLPSPQGRNVIGSGISAEKEKLPVIELGGVSFRVGLDTH